MDTVSLLDNDGKLYFIEPPNEKLNLVVDQGTISTSNFKRINRVSSSKWAIWAISSDFEVQLYVRKRHAPIACIVQTYENQKRFPIPSQNSQNNYSPTTDIPVFSSKDGKLELPRESFLLPSFNWIWDNEWYNESWKYSTSLDGDFRAKPFWYAKIRRRKWLRKRFFLTYETFITIDSPLTCEFINDICISEPLSEQNYLKGFLYVWIVSNCGRLFFRKNVSYENPEGTDWIEVKLPNDYKALSIACSQDGGLWIVTYEGNVIKRVGGNFKQPWGLDWIIIDSEDLFSFIQIVCNENTILALNSMGSVYLRIGIDEKCKQGLEWVKVLNGLSNISISLSNQLWAISADKMKLYIGNKIDSIESKLFSWRTISLPKEFDFIDARTAIDQMDDLASLKFK